MMEVNKLVKDVGSIINELKNLAEEMKSEMSANVYEYIWNMIQGIEHDFKPKAK